MRATICAVYRIAILPYPPRGHTPGVLGKMREKGRRCEHKLHEPELFATEMPVRIRNDAPPAILTGSPVFPSELRRHDGAQFRPCRGPPASGSAAGRNTGAARRGHWTICSKSYAKVSSLSGRCWDVAFRGFLHKAQEYGRLGHGRTPSRGRDLPWALQG